MTDIQITSVSSRGQVVIPQSIRDQLNIKPREKFAVAGEDGTIIFKRIEMPKKKDFDTLLKRTREFAKTTALAESHINYAIKKSRKK